MAGKSEIAMRLAALQELINAEKLCVETALIVLNTSPASLGPDMRDAIDHAKRAVVSAAGGNSRQEAVARYMMARVAILSERDAPA